MDWSCLSDAQQLDLADAAMRHAVGMIAHQAEILAGEIELGHLEDRGGPDALRLLAGLLRATEAEGPAAAGARA